MSEVKSLFRLNGVHSFPAVFRLSAALAQCRRAKEIISASMSTNLTIPYYQQPSRKHKQDEEEDSDNDCDGDTRKRKKSKSKVALDISLMEQFITKNVGHGRLAVHGQLSRGTLRWADQLPPPNHAGCLTRGERVLRQRLRGMPLGAGSTWSAQMVEAFPWETRSGFRAEPLL
jgi:hypothetical protein